jgi:dihydropteroate synthase
MSRPATNPDRPISSLNCGGRKLDLRRAAIMGVLNVTPDSFSDGGKFTVAAVALRHAEQMVAEGADIIDVGGESTRPGAQQISVQQELDRVIPVIEVLHSAVAVPVSIDTSKPEVMRHATAAGAGLINDVYGLRKQGALAAAAASGVPVCVMHMRGEPHTMQQSPTYNDVVADVIAFLSARRDECVAAGIPSASVIVDPGFGFGKTVAHNLALLRNLTALTALGAPILVGLSRKSMIGSLLDLPVDERAAASVALALHAVQQGANILRVHDVKMTRDAVRMMEIVNRRD